MFQEISVYVIGFALVVFLAFKLYGLVHKPYDPCKSCGGCELKKEMEQKKIECTVNGGHKKPGKQNEPGCGCGCG